MKTRSSPRLLIGVPGSALATPRSEWCPISRCSRKRARKKSCVERKQHHLRKKSPRRRKSHPSEAPRQSRTRACMACKRETRRVRDGQECSWWHTRQMRRRPIRRGACTCMRRCRAARVRGRTATMSRHATPATANSGIECLHRDSLARTLLASVARRPSFRARASREQELVSASQTLCSAALPTLESGARTRLPLRSQTIRLKFRMCVGP